MVFSKERWLENFKPYETLSARYQVQWQAAEKRNFQAHITLQSQQKVLIALQKSGFPFFRLLATESKMIAVNYLADAFWEDENSSHFPLPPQDIEHLFLARIDTTLMDKITYFTAEQAFVLPEEKEIFNQKIQKTTWIHPKLYVIERVLLQAKDWQVNIAYEYPKRNKKDFLLPHRLRIEYQAQENDAEKVVFSVKLNHLNLSPSQGRFKIKIPENYQKVERLLQLFP